MGGELGRVKTEPHKLAGVSLEGPHHTWIETYTSPKEQCVFSKRESNQICVLAISLARGRRMDLGSSRGGEEETGEQRGGCSI